MTCKHCGIDLKRWNRNTKYCSARCRLRNHRGLLPLRIDKNGDAIPYNNLADEIKIKKFFYDFQKKS